MKQTSRIISTYTGDTSGVCSALYELGGMTVMHDPSGCNSTYSTHDEPRWYDTDSLVFISGLTEKDAIFGNDEKIIADTVEAAMELKPRFISIAGSPIPYITGCDYNAIAMEIENRCGIPTFGFDTDGMRSYIHGASLAFAEYVDKMCKEVPKSSDLSVNLLGVTPLDFSINGCVESMKDNLENNGIKVNSVIAMGSSWKEVENAAAATVNLVVSSCGLACAKVLSRKFGTPYVIGAPFGRYMTDYITSCIKSCTNEKSRGFAVECSHKADTYIIGEGITSLSLSKILRIKNMIHSKVISPADTPGEIEACGCICTDDEDEIMKRIHNAKCVIADPMYKPICSKNTRFIELPHEAFSGRIFRSTIPNLAKDAEEFLNTNF